MSYEALGEAVYKKYCPNCLRFSYSSCSERKWLCPSCRSDLTSMEGIFCRNVLKYSAALAEYKQKNHNRREVHFSKQI